MTYNLIGYVTINNTQYACKQCETLFKAIFINLRLLENYCR